MLHTATRSSAALVAHACSACESARSLGQPASGAISVPRNRRRARCLLCRNVHAPCRGCQRASGDGGPGRAVGAGVEGRRGALLLRARRRRRGSGDSLNMPVPRHGMAGPGAGRRRIMHQSSMHVTIGLLEDAACTVVGLLAKWYDAGCGRGGLLQVACACDSS